MSLPTPEQFPEFYAAVNRFEPFPWQKRLAQRVCNGDWPRAIVLPVAAGKTAFIDIALFALACHAKGAARRIFFLVDRRTFVDQAKLQADQIANVLCRAESGILREVADSLRELGQSERPVEAYSLLGGMYRETAWTRSPLQPTVVTSSVDQIGSRLLFRGYGVSDSMKPIQAGLVGNDALILLDEAHNSQPFYQTMQAVKKYRQWHDGNKPIAVFEFVSISATPTEEIQEAERQRQRDCPNDRPLIEEAQDGDRTHSILGKRMSSSKPATLVVANKAKGKNATTELVSVLEKHAQELANDFACIGIIVNRVKTARELKARLGGDAVLLTGRMRPLDCARMFDEKLRPLLSNAEGTPPKFVIGTQCLECGADFDFHALVTECASLDALRQRFGRLNRVANRHSAKAIIVIRGDQIENTRDDSIYGESLANTWKWLKSKAVNDFFDFGDEKVRAHTKGVDLAKLNAPTENALILFPAHVDCLVQTNPIPKPDPDPAWFIHGPKRFGRADVQVVFRRDLGLDTKKWCDIVTLCPPSTFEAVRVPIGVFKRWLAGEYIEDQSSDVEGEAIHPEGESLITRSALRWGGPEKSQVILELNQITPGDTCVIPASANGAKYLGDFPYGISDLAEESYQRSHDRAMLRLTYSKLIDDGDDFEALLTEQVSAQLKSDSPDWLKRAVAELVNLNRREIVAHPGGGWIVYGKRRLRQFDPTYLDDSEPDDSFRGRTVSLLEHSSNVAELARRFAAGCRLEVNVFRQAGLWHDLGKLDRRFQAMLKQSSPRTAVGIPIAKSDRSPRTNQGREEARQIHHYPSGVRHELLSAALVATKTDGDLLLHLIATHHGCARPFADPVVENSSGEAPFQTAESFGQSFELPTSAQQIKAWNAALPERFWRVIREYGWWGTAYREAVFRLADHAQGRAEQTCKGKKNDAKAGGFEPPSFMRSQGSLPPHSLPLSGLDGSNPLAFLAALGTLVLLDRFSRSEDHPRWLNGTVAMSWQGHLPILYLPGVPPTPDKLADFLSKHCDSTIDQHPAKFAVSFFENNENRVSRLCEFVQNSSPANRTELDWVAAHFSEAAEDATSQLLIVRRDHLPNNVRSILDRCRSHHLFRALFQTWDYADGLHNQSLHWEPSEDRRYAYQWSKPNDDPTRKKRGGMLGANRLALEAWPLFPSFPSGDRLTTLGFKGKRTRDTYWTWPLWEQPLTRDSVSSMLGLAKICAESINSAETRSFGVSAVFRLQRILVGKTPNFTMAGAIA